MTIARIHQHLCGLLRFILTHENKCLPDSEFEPPPPYNQSAIDPPPPYEPHAPLTVTSKRDAQNTFGIRPPPYEDVPPLPNPMPKQDVDFDDFSTFRQAGAKQKKKAQKQADQAKWFDSGDEGNNEEGNGGDGDGAGGGGNGDGGAGGDDGGGDDWNDWNVGKKKKGKKAKEEEKKKQEEEEEAKKKEEEEKSHKSKGADLSWADEDPGDDWGAFATTTAKKDKKDKKKKAR